MLRVIFDTNVLVSGLRSKCGASYALIDALPSRRFQPVLSIPLYCEYLDVLNRPGIAPAAFSREDIGRFCRSVAALSHRQQIYFLWRTFLPDEKDSMVLELALAARASYIVTHNVKHFRPATETFQIKVVTPAEFIARIGGLP